MGGYGTVQEGAISAGLCAGADAKMHDGPPGSGGVGTGRVRVVTALAAAVLAAVEEGDLEVARVVAGALVAAVR